jgi:hypothetical protein
VHGGSGAEQKTGRLGHLAASVTAGMILNSLKNHRELLKIPDFGKTSRLNPPSGAAAASPLPAMLSNAKLDQIKSCFSSER